MILALTPLLLLVGTTSALMALDERALSEHERQVLVDEYGAGYILPDKLSPQAVKVMADVNGVENVDQFESFLYDDALTFDVEHLEGDIKTTARTVRKRDTDEFEHILTTDTGHKMRIKNPKDLDLDKTRQFAGYFDTPEDDHFFFWMFESRHNPQTDPVIMWLNGGPGCSSMTGMLFENGPSRIDKKGRTTPNPYSWNNNATVIYLDQPVNVGYSYSNKYVSRTTDAAKDVFVFLSLFFQHFRPLSHRKFHIAGESYAGHYIPAIIDEVEKHKYRRFNVSSVLIGNGLVDPLNQYKSYAPMACGDGEYKQVLTNDACDTLSRETSLCTRLVKTCYSHPNVSLACGGATVLCSALTNAYRNTNLNPYDIREVCKEPPLCYEELSAIEDYMNQDKVRDAIGAEVDKFISCSRTVQKMFTIDGDHSRPFQDSVGDMLDRGTPVLVYAGDKDYICNWVGQEDWTNGVDWKHGDNFEKASYTDWNVNGKKAGKKKNIANFTFLRVFDAGHMVPYNKPQEALAMVNQWMSGNHALE